MAARRIMEHRRPKPLKAWRAVRDLFEEPEETSHVFRVIRYLSSSRRYERLFARVMADPEGRRVLERDNDLIGILDQRDRLRSLPHGTLGREYARFMDAENITAGGLEEASSTDRVEFYDERAERLSERLRDMHDLWHVVTGYGRDFVGEDALLAFSYAQTRNLGIALITTLAYLRFRREGFSQALPVIRAGYRRGRRAALLPAADWEALLELPLDEVRRRLRVDAPPVYEPLDQSDFDQAQAAAA